MKPKPGTVRPEPNSSKLLFTQDTMLPSASARQLFCFNHQMPVLGIRRAERCQCLPRHPERHARLEDAEHFIGCPRLRRRRQFDDVVAVIARVRALDPFALILGEILERHRAAERLGFRDDGLRDLAPIKRVGAVLLQEPKRSR